MFDFAMMALAFTVDVRSRHSRDFAFWLYSFGIAALWGGLTAAERSHEIYWLGNCLANSP